MTSLREFDLRPSIRNAAAEIGYHDELAVDIQYAWEEERPGQDEPVSKGVRRSKRSTPHAIKGVLCGPYVDEDDRRETAAKAANILQGWYDGLYRESEGSFDDWTRTPMETSEARRHIDLDAPADVDVTAELVDKDEALKDEDAASYCHDIIETYVDTRIGNGLWREKPHTVADILERNGDTFLADIVETHTRQPEVTIGHNVYTEHVDPDEADTPEEYLEGLEKDRFQPI